MSGLVWFWATGGLPVLIDGQEVDNTVIDFSDLLHSQVSAVVLRLVLNTPGVAIDANLYLEADARSYLRYNISGSAASSQTHQDILCPIDDVASAVRYSLDSAPSSGGLSVYVTAFQLRE